MASIKAIREAAERDLYLFIQLVAPYRLLPHIHEEVIQWWTREDAKSHQMLLLPRDHGKSALIAFRVAWEITRNPIVTAMYLSSTASLAEKQLGMIKGILTSPKYRLYWPEMVNEDEAKRARWSISEIEVDHPRRKEEGIRDPTVFTAGLGTSRTGFHCDIAVLDDVVVQENAYTEQGRETVRRQYSLLASIEHGEAREWVVGTRYHPNDLYNDLLAMEREIFDEEGNVIEKEPIYEVFVREVEDRGDGTGQFLWPRQQRHDGAWFGFDRNILATKRGQYLDKTQFYAQYYNNPNVYETALITPDKFQYFERQHLVQKYGKWYMRGKPINVFAAMDFAFSINKRSDFTALVVIGIDGDGMIYVLDIDRFKTEKISEMFNHLRDAHVKWGFRKVRMEMTAAQKAIVKELKDQYIRPYGLALSVDEYYPSRNEGAKDERIMSILEPRYDNLSVWHYRGGNCTYLEEELVQRHPAHDDCMDALAAAIAFAVPPRDSKRLLLETERVRTHSRFGGTI